MSYKPHRNEKARWDVAWLKIVRGLTLQQIAATLGIKQKLAAYYWATAQRIIRGQDMSEYRKRDV